MQLKSSLAVLTSRKQGKSAQKMDSKTSQQIEMWPYEVVFRHTYPRLDINVSKMQNHLLKCPFCIHPKTGRVCIPMDASDIDNFDPFDVPTLPQIVDELDSYARVHGEEAAAKVPNWQKTSMKKSMQFFLKSFLNPMKNDWRKLRVEAAEKVAAITGDF